MSKRIFDKNCTRCILHHAAKSVCIPSDGPDDADILFYGEAPGADEDEANTPFVGAAGRELDELLSKANLPRRSVRISNTVRCRPPANRAPTKDEIDACAFYTVKEIVAVQPQVIVALGASAIKALTGQTAVGKNRGKMLALLPQYRSDVPVLATYHPAAYLHNAGMRSAYSKAIVEDMQLAQKIASGALLQAKIVTSQSKPALIEKTLRRLAKCEILGCDLEWEVLPEQKKEPRGMWPWSQRQGRMPRSVSVAIAGRVNGTVLSLSVPFTSEYAHEIRRIIRNVPTIYHNGLADLIWFYALGWVVVIEGDSYLLASLLSIDSSLSLEALALTLTDMPAWKKDSGAGMYPNTEAEWRRLLRRNAKDAIATLILHDKLLEMVHERKRSSVIPLYDNVLIPATAILARTALNGTPIDEALLKKMRKQLRRRMSEVTEQIGDTLKLPADYEDILTKSAKLAPYLEQVGIKLPRTKKTNKPSLTNDVLIQHRDSHPIVKALLTHRSLAKRESSYYRPWTWLLNTQRDSRLHTLYKLTAASTGRSSAEGELGYTFQQFPRGEKIRRLVKADEGRLILGVDQSQIELRLIAWKARERRMLDFFARGDDLHEAMASFMKALGRGWTLERYLKEEYGWRRGVTKEERTGAKPVNFGLSYGGGPSVVQKTARKDYGITFTDEQAQTGYDAYHLFYPDIRPWQETFWRDVQRGYGETSLGRRRSVSEDAEGPEGLWRKYINLDIQATASDLSLFCMDYMWELMEAAHKDVHRFVENIGFFHDAAFLHFDADLRDEIEPLVKHAWEHPPLDRLDLEIDVPLVADIKIGKRWTT